MLRKTITLAVTSFLALSFAVPHADAVGYTAEQRAVIRAMPIQERPNRTGHFYGNTVRALVKRGVIHVHE
jgi:hypothetical protein